MTVDSMAAVAILTCQPSSHPFNERQIALHEPVKVGRSVARARPAPNNAIFDCKVLSRNHAMLWYESGKFYLQDTKSSNGTFVNHQRLSKGSEESAPREVFSGDIIQFGVDVMENSRRDEGHFVTVTHGCIIATITLYHADGSEAKPNYAPNAITGNGGPTLGAHSQELYQLAQYLQEALHREQMLENKLATLQRLIESTQEASETGWQALIDEDRLLSRLEVLESQLQAYAKNQTEDNLRHELVALQEDKHNYETTAKESLRRILEEKLEAVRKLSDLEQSLSNTEDECGHLKEMFELSQRELEQLAGTHQETNQEVEDLKEKLKEAQENYEKELQLVKEEKHEIQTKLDEMAEQEVELSTKVQSLQNEAQKKKEQMDAIKVHLEEMERNSDNRLIETVNQEIQVDLMVEKGELDFREDERDAESLAKKLRETQEQMEIYRAQIKEAENRLVESHDKVDQLKNQLDKAEEEERAHVAKITSIEAQLNESKKQADNNSDLSMKLHQQIETLETRLRECNQEATNVTIMSTSDDTNSNPISAQLSNHVESIISMSKQSHIDDLEQLKELLCEARDAHQRCEAEITKYKVELEQAQTKSNHQLEEARLIKGQLSETMKAGKDKDEYIQQLQDQLTRAEVTIQEVKKQILLLRDELDQEKSAHLMEQREFETIQRQLIEAQQSSKQSRAEADQLRIKTKELHDLLEKEKVALKDTSVSKAIHSADEVSSGTMKSSEFSALRQECDHLRQRILKIEADMRLSKQENHQLSADYSRLQESYNDLEHLKDRLELQCKANMTDSQKEADQLKQVVGLTGSEEHVTELTQRVSSCQDEIRHLQDELNDMSSQYYLLADKSRTLSYCAMIPIIVLIFGIMIAFYPLLAALTATSTLD